MPVAMKAKEGEHNGWDPVLAEKICMNAVSVTLPRGLQSALDSPERVSLLGTKNGLACTKPLLLTS